MKPPSASLDGAPAARTTEVTAALLMTASTALFGVGDAVVKLLTEGWPVAQIVLVRSAMALPLLLLWRPAGEAFLPRGLAQPWNLVRCALEVGVTFCYFAGLALLPLGDAVALTFLSPILLTLAAALLLGERVGWRRWAAIALGFVGVIVVTRPGQASFTAAALLPLAAACCIAGRDLVVRRLGPEVSTRAIVLASTLALTAAGLVALPAGSAPVRPALLLGGGAAALIVTAAFVCYVRATRIGDVAAVQPFKFLAIPIAFVVGWLVWGTVPDAQSLAGAALIAIASALVIRRAQPRPTAA